MSSPHPVAFSTAPRFGGRLPLVASMALVFTAGTFPLGAQQAVEIRRSPRAEPGDSVDRQLRRLQAQLDSLARNYTEREDLTAVERQRLATEISRSVSRWVELSARMSDDVAPRADVRLRLMQMGERAAASPMTRAFAQLLETQAATPRGWIGIVVEGVGLDPRVEHGEFIVRYLSYPRIVSVDPSSPAQRAGIAPNDTLVAYDGSDVRDNEISLTSLLRPSALVRVKVRRDGMVREIPVTVAAVPSRIVQRRGDEVRDAREAAVIQDGPLFFPDAPRPPTAPRVGARMTMSAVPAQAPQAPGTIPPIPPFVSTVTGVAGASLVAIDEGLARLTGIGWGVVVTSAPVGSPANESGLKSGDVIVNVAGQPVKTVTEVRRLVGKASDNGARSVELEIIREKKSQKISLRW